MPRDPLDDLDLDSLGFELPKAPVNVAIPKSNLPVHLRKDFSPQFHLMDKALLQGGLTLRFPDREAAYSQRLLIYRARMQHRIVNEFETTATHYDSIYVRLNENVLSIKIMPDLDSLEI